MDKVKDKVKAAQAAGHQDKLLADELANFFYNIRGEDKKLGKPGAILAGTLHFIANQCDRIGIGPMHGFSDPEFIRVLSSDEEFNELCAQYFQEAYQGSKPSGVRPPNISSMRRSRTAPAEVSSEEVQPPKLAKVLFPERAESTTGTWWNTMLYDFRLLNTIKEDYPVAIFFTFVALLTQLGWELLGEIRATGDVSRMRDRLLSPNNGPLLALCCLCMVVYGTYYKNQFDVSSDDDGAGILSVAFNQAFGSGILPFERPHAGRMLQLLYEEQRKGNDIYPSEDRVLIMVEQYYTAAGQSDTWRLIKNSLYQNYGWTPATSTGTLTSWFRGIIYGENEQCNALPLADMELEVAKSRKISEFLGRVASDRATYEDVETAQRLCIFILAAGVGVIGAGSLLPYIKAKEIVSGKTLVGKLAVKCANTKPQGRDVDAAWNTGGAGGDQQAMFLVMRRIVALSGQNGADIGLLMRKMNDLIDIRRSSWLSDPTGLQGIDQAMMRDQFTALQNEINAYRQAWNLNHPGLGPNAQIQASYGAGSSSVVDAVFARCLRL